MVFFGETKNLNQQIWLECCVDIQKNKVTSEGICMKLKDWFLAKTYTFIFIFSNFRQMTWNL
jgi:hypothetical protein